MKKLTVLSIIAAALLLTACGDSATGAEAKAATEAKTEAAPMKCGEGKCGEGKCGGDKKSVATEVVDKATEVVKETATAAVASVKSAVASVVNTDAGKKLYAKCAGCHGSDGKSKAMGKATPVAGQSAADLETKLAGYKAGTQNAVGMGMLMKGQVASLSDDDIKAVAAYMSSL